MDVETMRYYVSTGLWSADRVEKLYQAKKITKEHYDELKALLTLPTDKSGGFSVQRVSRRGCVLRTLPERIGSGVSRPTICIAYAKRRSPSFKIFFAAFVSLSWTVPQEGQFHSRTERSFVPGH